MQSSFWHFTGTKGRQLSLSLFLSLLPPTPSESLFLIFSSTEDVHNQLPWLVNCMAPAYSSVLIHKLCCVSKEIFYFLCGYQKVSGLRARGFLEVSWDVAGSEHLTKYENSFFPMPCGHKPVSPSYTCDCEVGTMPLLRAPVAPPLAPTVAMEEDGVRETGT